MSKILINNTILYSIGEVVPRLLSLILLPIYTHYLSPTDFGILSYTTSIMVFLPILSTLCLNSFLLRSFFKRNTESEKRKLVGNIFLFITIINVFFLISGFFLIPKIIDYFHVNVPWDPYFRLAFIACFLDVFSIIPLVLYRLRQNAKFFVVLSLAKVILQYINIFIFIVIFDTGILGYYYGNVFALIPFFIIYWIIIIKQSTLNFNWSEIKEGLLFSLPLLPGAVAYLLLNFSDRILLEQSVSLSEIGVYSIAHTLAFSLNMVILSVYKAIEPEIFKRYGTADFDRFILKSKSVFFMIIYFSALTVSLFSQEFFILMAPTIYYNGHLFVPIIMVGVIMTAQNVIYAGILTAENNTKVLGIATLVGVLLNIVFNFIFIPQLGVMAAAISISVSFSLINFILYFKMTLINKSFKPELMSIGVYLFIILLFFYLIDLQPSVTTSILKIVILISYLTLLLKIFKIETNAFWIYFKKTFYSNFT